MKIIGDPDQDGSYGRSSLSNRMSRVTLLVASAIFITVVVAGLGWLFTSPWGGATDPSDHPVVEKADIIAAPQTTSRRAAVAGRGATENNKLKTDRAVEESDKPKTYSAVEESDELISATSAPLPIEPKESNERPTLPTANDPLAEEDEFLSISGIIVDEMGEVVPGIEVVASWKNLFLANEGDFEASRSERKHSAVTDSEGFYQFRWLYDGEYQIRTQANDRYAAAQIVVRAGVESADLVLRELRPDVRVFGTVQSDVAPLEHVQVLAIGQSRRAVHTNQEGFYELVLEVTKSKSNYTLQFIRAGYREQRSVLQTQKMTEFGEIQVDTELEPIEEVVEVYGSVRSEKGLAIPGETVQLYSEATRQHYSAVSERGGMFWFPEVETGSGYTLSVHPTDSYRDFFIRDVEITRAGENLQVVLKPSDLGRLTGQMVDPKGDPLPEFSLWLHNTDAANQPVLLVTGDSQGRFAVDRIQEGTLVFETHSSPQYNISGIHLSAGEEQDIRLVIDWGSHQIAGRMLDELGRPVPASELSVTWFRRDSGVRSYATRNTITDGEGYFLFTQVGPGYHTIRIDVPGFRATQLDHEVVNGASDVLVRLERDSTHGT